MATTVQHLPAPPLPAAPDAFMAGAAAFFLSAGLLPQDAKVLFPFPVASELEAAMQDALVAATLDVYAQPWTR